MVISGYPGCMQKPVKLLRRLTILVEDPSLLHVLASPAVSQYDIVAIQPNSERTFQQACATLPVDIVTMEMTEQLPFILRRQQIGQAIERGLMFEICYSPAILDANARRYTFSNALNLVRLCKGKNVIVSSKAQQPMELRAPYDVANLCHLFGIKGGGKCKDLITTHCQLAVLHAEMRRGSAKGIVTSCSVQNLEEEERWQIADPFDITSGARLKPVDDMNDETPSELKSSIRKRSQSHTPTRESKKAKTTEK
ncbi:ribonuclease P protein subunit p30-like isoform X2 [Dysidea avara]